MAGTANMPVCVCEIYRVPFIEPEAPEFRSKVVFVPAYSLRVRENGK
jgi:hypothetical protein